VSAQGTKKNRRVRLIEEQAQIAIHAWTRPIDVKWVALIKLKMRRDAVEERIGFGVNGLIGNA